MAYMAVYIVMPKLGLTMKEGTLTKWLKKVGDRVAKGEEVAEVSTEKITNVVESPADGILGKILVSEGAVVPVATPIGIILAEGEKLPVEDEAGPANTSSSTVAVQASELETPEVEKNQEKFVKATPLARKIAKENNVDLSLIAGTGPGGRITEEDVRKYIENRMNVKKESPAVVEEITGSVKKVPMDNMRRVIAERMKNSWNSAPHVTENIKVDVTELVKFREELNKFADEKFTYTDLIAKACVLALKRNPVINWSIEGEYIIQHEKINLGIAVALENGLIVPVIKDAGSKSLTEISKMIKDLSARARENRLSPEEIKDGTFTITNLGMYGIDSFTPIINPPESAILGVNTIYKEPAVVGDSITIRQVMMLSLSFDHRLIDGATAAKFLMDLKRILENPAALAL
ncbi:Dihydrolipoyllysine-residue succinyltransferase component of 2-oxoglutarate dehydrogenase complex [Fervidicola ferrireducens]|uniref:Dihydrolipoamide acetyltransferase component of pyruvate dehydrogenase complex n=1 Tax=Fervidicola ferrireducens TaxID=520764 RepID=A0A140LBM8_9FIRM|nr:dihydrolipoamide acetyltransferase family protein [Fervidicola ferrireducens]KXG77953.1 Dihydrolipoyllysine-residue succinyltransferase component of 2-oxoglutarate dehydrogenase complex [Fervidicola ferrireducens]